MEWTDVVEHVRAQHQIGRATEAWLELWRSFREGRRAIRQQQTLRAVEHHGETYLVIEAEVGVPRGARAALCATARLALGRLVERAGALSVHAQAPLRALTPAALDRLLAAVGGEAMRLAMGVWREQAAATAAAAAREAAAREAAAQEAAEEDEAAAGPGADPELAEADTWVGAEARIAEAGIAEADTWLGAEARIAAASAWPGADLELAEADTWPGADPGMAAAGAWPGADTDTGLAAAPPWPRAEGSAPRRIAAGTAPRMHLPAPAPAPAPAAAAARAALPQLPAAAAPSPTTTVRRSPPPAPAGPSIHPPASTRSPS